MVLKRDENGRVVKVGGICGLTLEYLANSLHFTYTFKYIFMHWNKNKKLINFRFEYVYESDFPNILDDQGPQKPGRISKFINSVYFSYDHLNRLYLLIVTFIFII